MTIRRKIILIVLPLLLTPIILTGTVSSLSARNGISIIASDFLKFKIETLKNYASGQWNLLENNNLDTDPDFINAAKDSIKSFSSSIIRNDTEIIIAVDTSGSMVMSTRNIDITPVELDNLIIEFKNESEGWQRISLAGEHYVGQKTVFDNFGWFVLAAEKERIYYSAITNIYIRTFIILSVSIITAVILLILFSNILTRQLVNIVNIIQDIITTGDLSKKVTLKYRDETGKMGHYFNLLTDELGKAYQQIKNYAYEMVLAKNKEKQIRNIFQKYVPKNVIEQFEINPETMLIGDNRRLAILFSDIRSFTTISETLTPEILVKSLNRYFEKLVEIIQDHNGIVDKYIGDAIMAFFGAPVKTDDDALKSVQAGLRMMSEIDIFNKGQKELGIPPFRTGIGINYGNVVVGNIGSERKMDYTVIGDTVNLASRLEGLSKYYHEPIIIADTLKHEIDNFYPCRLLDKVVVKGKTRAVEIFTVRESLTVLQKNIWDMHKSAINLYLHRNFKDAGKLFSEMLSADPHDYISRLYLDRSREFTNNPPPENWQGENTFLVK
jgi:class 3 adenylate cyclase